MNQLSVSHRRLGCDLLHVLSSAVRTTVLRSPHHASAVAADLLRNILDPLSSLHLTRFPTDWLRTVSSAQSWQDRLRVKRGPLAGRRTVEVLAVVIVLSTGNKRVSGRFLKRGACVLRLEIGACRAWQGIVSKYYSLNSSIHRSPCLASPTWRCCWS